MSTDLIHSKHRSCRLCNSSRLRCIVPLHPIPIGEHYSEKPQKEGIRYPIDLYHCMECSCVQTNDDIDPEYLWKDYTYYSSHTPRIVQHFLEFAELVIDDYGTLMPTYKVASVLDIGSNDGSLLAAFKAKGFDVYGIDPAEAVASVAIEQDIPTVVALFDEESVGKHFSGMSFNIITAFNVFAHSNNMTSMARAVKSCLADDGLFFFEVQYLGDISEKKIVGTVFHEHMIHYSLTSAKNFLSLHGLKIINYYRNNIQNGSIIFVVVHDDSKQAKTLDLNHKLLQLSEWEHDNGITNADWAHSFNDYINDTRRQALGYLNGKKVSAYGAARSGPTLAIQFGLDGSIDKIYDDHLSKSGKYSPFNNLKVLPTSNLEFETSPICVILAYIHSRNIIGQHRDYVRSGGTFIILWPCFQLINSSNIRLFLGE